MKTLLQKAFGLGERRRLYRLIDRMKFGGTFRHDFNFSEDAT